MRFSLLETLVTGFSATKTANSFYAYYASYWVHALPPQSTTPAMTQLLQRCVGAAPCPRQAPQRRRCGGIAYAVDSSPANGNVDKAPVPPKPPLPPRVSQQRHAASASLSQQHVAAADCVQPQQHAATPPPLTPWDRPNSPNGSTSPTPAKGQGQAPPFGTQPNPAPPMPWLRTYRQLSQNSNGVALPSPQTAGSALEGPAAAGLNGQPPPTPPPLGPPPAAAQAGAAAAGHDGQPAPLGDAQQSAAQGLPGEGVETRRQTAKNEVTVQDELAAGDSQPKKAKRSPRNKAKPTSEEGAKEPRPKATRKKSTKPPASSPVAASTDADANGNVEALAAAEQQPESSEPAGYQPVIGEGRLVREEELRDEERRKELVKDVAIVTTEEDARKASGQRLFFSPF